MFQSEDVGDNHRHRGTVQIYRVEEPKVEPNRNRNDDIRPDADALFCEIRQTCLRRIAMDRMAFWVKVSCISCISLENWQTDPMNLYDLTHGKLSLAIYPASLWGSTQSVSMSPIPTAWSTIVRQRTLLWSSQDLQSQKSWVY